MRESQNPPSTTVEVSWAMFHRDARQLAAQLKEIGAFSAIVAVTRGGLAPAAIVARELGVRIVETLGVSSYQAETQQGAISVIKPMTEILRAHPPGDVVVIDDLADTGATARAVRELLPGAHIAVLYVKPRGLPTVDTFVAEFPQDSWIYFPWDLGDDHRYQPPLRMV